MSYEEIARVGQRAARDDQGTDHHGRKLARPLLRGNEWRDEDRPGSPLRGSWRALLLGGCSFGDSDPEPGADLAGPQRRRPRAAGPPVAPTTRRWTRPSSEPGRGPVYPASETPASTRCTTGSTWRGRRDRAPSRGSRRWSSEPRPTPTSSSSTSGSRSRSPSSASTASRRTSRRTARTSSSAPPSRPTAATSWSSTTAARREPVRAPTTRSDFDTLGWQVTDSRQSWTMQEPYGAFTWYAVNDQPSDKALYDFTISTPAPWVGVANGELVSREDLDGDTVTRWHLDEPASSYLVTAAVGDFRMERDRSASGVPITYWTRAWQHVRARAGADGRRPARLDRGAAGAVSLLLAGRSRGRLRDRHGDPDDADPRRQRLRPEPGR